MASFLDGDLYRLAYLQNKDKEENIQLKAKIYLSHHITLVSIDIYLDIFICRDPFSYSMVHQNISDFGCQKTEFSWLPKYTEILYSKCI